MSTATTGQAWTLDHEVHLLAQTESRLGEDGWVERRPAGKIRAVCSCGYDSGLVDRGTLSADYLREHHNARI